MTLATSYKQKMDSLVLRRNPIRRHTTASVVLEHLTVLVPETQRPEDPSRKGGTLAHAVRYFGALVGYPGVASSDEDVGWLTTQLCVYEKTIRQLNREPLWRMLRVMGRSRQAGRLPL